MNNLIIKVLVFSVVLSLLPLLVEISPIEYQGASLMAADDDKRRRKKEEEQNFLVKKLKKYFNNYSL